MSESGQERSEESLRHEYSEVISQVRHISNLRFAVFSIFLALMAGVGFVAFGKDQFDAHAATVARFAGFLVTAIFWVWQENISRFWDHSVKVAIALERSLGYTLFTSVVAMPRSLPVTKVVVRVFFFLLTLLWVYAVFAVPLDR